MKTDEGTIASSLNALQHLPINFCLLSLHSRKYLSTSIYFYFAFHSLGVTVTLFWRNHIWQIFKYGNGICVQREGYCIKSHCEIHTSHYTVYVSIRSSAVWWKKGTIDRLNVSKVLQRLYAECRCREKEIKTKKRISLQIWNYCNYYYSRIDRAETKKCNKMWLKCICKCNTCMSVK